jgi:outer membrane protein assembly factor BamD (BamD/ComL family)
MRKHIISIIVFLIILYPLTGYSTEDACLYRDGIKAMRNGDIDTAFMNFHLLLNTNPNSSFAHDCLLALGDYYFSNNAHSDACHIFEQFMDQFPESEAKIFVFAYLLEIAAREKNEELIKNLKKEIITFMQISLLFRDFKEYKYSPSYSKNYKAVYFIDKIEFYVDEVLFTKIYY